MRSLRAFFKKGCRKVARAKAQNEHKQAEKPRIAKKNARAAQAFLMFGIRRLPIFPPEAPTVRQGRSASQTLLELPALLDLLFASSSTGRAHSRSHHQPLAVLPGPENTYSSKTKEKHHALHGVLLWYPAATYFPGPSPAKYLRRIRA